MKLLRSRYYPTIVAIVLLAGCTSSEDADLPPLVPVTGVVTLDDRPLAKAQVTFVPQGNTQANVCWAMTDAEGRYTLETMHRGAGAAAGEYKVTISKLVQPDGSDFPDDAQLDPMSTPHKELLPKTYSDLEQTTLTASVPEGGRTFDFKLQSKR